MDELSRGWDQTEVIFLIFVQLSGAHLWLNRYVSEQIYIIWSNENTQSIFDTPLHSQIETGHNVTVNAEYYWVKINDFFVPEFEDGNVDDFWFQRDGATWHAASETINLLKETFVYCINLRRGPASWYPRSCDLTFNGWTISCEVM